MKTTLWDIEKEFSVLIEEAQESLIGISECLGKNYLKVYGEYDKYSSWLGKLDQALSLIREVEERVYLERETHYI